MKSSYTFFLFFIACSIPKLTFAQNWTRAAEIPPTYVYMIVEHNGMLFASTDSSIYFSTNEGLSWNPTLTQPASTQIFTLFFIGSTLYVGTFGDGVFYTHNNGQSWQALNSGLPGSARNITQFAVRDDSLYAATNGDGVYVINLPNPTSWVPFNNGLFQFGSNAVISSESTLFACIGNYVFKHTQGSPEWINVGDDSLQMQTPLTIFRHNSHLFLGTTGGVFRSDLEGTLWQKTDILAFPNRDIVSFASNGNRIFAGLNYLSDHWLWSSDNFGSSWDVRAHEFATLFSLFSFNGRMWACRSDGLWSVDMGGWTDVLDFDKKLLATPILYQNYPNPFNPETTIEFYLPRAELVTLTIFNSIGMEVETLVNEHLSSGTHRVKWNSHNYASGIYFYELRFQNFKKTNKLMLIK